MTGYSRGDVVLVSFVFTDETGVRQRPAVIISSDAYHRGREEAIIAAITSRTDRVLVGDHLISHWREAGLLFPSVATGIIRMKYPHLGLLEWPFRVVPDESFYSFMADREQLVSDIRTLLRNLSRRSASSMHLMWAWSGAGKTHTLRHMEYLCRNEFTNFVPI